MNCLLLIPFDSLHTFYAASQLIILAIIAPSRAKRPCMHDPVLIYQMIFIQIPRTIWSWISVFYKYPHLLDEIINSQKTHSFFYLALRMRIITYSVAVSPVTVSDPQLNTMLCSILITKKYFEVWSNFLERLRTVEGSTGNRYSRNYRALRNQLEPVNEKFAVCCNLSVKQTANMQTSITVEN